MHTFFFKNAVKCPLETFIKEEMGLSAKWVAFCPFGTHPTFSDKAEIGAKSTYLPPVFYLKSGKSMFLKPRITSTWIFFDFIYGFLSHKKLAKPENPAGLPTYLW